MKEKVITYIKSILLPVLIGAAVGIITSRFNDYDTLIQPPLAPPGILFPIVWTILYILMGISYGILKTNSLNDGRTDLIYYTQLAINALWSIFFFVFKWRLFSFFWLVALIILVAIMVYEFYKKNKVAGLLQLPYLAWTLFAAYLNLAVYILNG